MAVKKSQIILICVIIFLLIIIQSNVVLCEDYDVGIHIFGHPVGKQFKGSYAQAAGYGLASAIVDILILIVPVTVIFYLCKMCH